MYLLLIDNNNSGSLDYFFMNPMILICKVTKYERKRNRSNVKT